MLDPWTDGNFERISYRSEGTLTQVDLDKLVSSLQQQGVWACDRGWLKSDSTGPSVSMFFECNGRSISVKNLSEEGPRGEKIERVLYTAFERELEALRERRYNRAPYGPPFEWPAGWPLSALP